MTAPNLTDEQREQLAASAAIARTFAQRKTARVCEECKADFVGAGRGRFCSGSCRLKAWRRSRK